MQKILAVETQVSQWRNHRGRTLSNLIYSPVLHSRAWQSMGWEGARPSSVSHTRATTKRSLGTKIRCSGQSIPGHGVSTWTPLLDVSLEDGCLEVIDKSHLGGCSSWISWPRRKMSSRIQSRSSSSCGRYVLHSLTWHRSSPNKGSHDRRPHWALDSFRLKMEARLG